MSSYFIIIFFLLFFKLMTERIEPKQLSLLTNAASTSRASLWGDKPCVVQDSKGLSFYFHGVISWWLDFPISNQFPWSKSCLSSRSSSSLSTRDSYISICFPLDDWSRRNNPFAVRTQSKVTNEYIKLRSDRDRRGQPGKSTRLRCTVSLNGKLWS